MFKEFLEKFRDNRRVRYKNIREIVGFDSIVIVNNNFGLIFSYIKNFYSKVYLLLFLFI